MKKNAPVIILIALSISIIHFSCSKGSTSTTVEYRIAPMNNSFIKITYNDATGASVMTTNLADFPNGSRSISISAKPFTAKITTEANNQTNTTINYNLVILVDGDAKILVPCSAPPMTASTISSAQFVVQ